MRRSRAFCTAIAAIVAAILIAVAYAAATASVSALPNPGALETRLLTRVKLWYIARAARHPPPPPPPARTSAAITAGAGLYGMECAFCHGQDPHTLAPIAHSMYPRALNLSSREVQDLTDEEIFWVIRHGIRLSAMPGFAPINSGPELWELTFYVRSLGEK